ncbi:uncharacterized protein Z518_01981 [Rhinocladiella mackenziei CBS 650.93]|uniref:Uncharacterized protein n=1 Tax=Rhinocladiella mackenziei CBS 650.93 TaxID=1442369 RepID=A0A0D2HA17_9EURO|nr:uncharacterized protein Z518_01981 [Rhinocladiella mackenziei CBS 650.93]KIX07328.1 hypothetical protein Z518_01981 [Rhinocladiella mackenziei CBS 650.93]
MPTKKSKANATKGKVSTPSTSTQATKSTPPAPTKSSSSWPPLPSLSTLDDFGVQNARAKALIMSTLVPGSEPWKIAERLELASDIWKALENKYVPMNGSKRAGLSKTNNETGEEGNDLSSSDFIGDWVEGKPMDKYLEMYKTKKKVKDRDENSRVGLAASTPREDNLHRASPVPERVRCGDKHENQKAARPGATPKSSALWRATPVNHGSYLSEGQAWAFASYDVERKKQIQVAATKAMMRKLPTRDLRFLWAILYGGENAPWPGSWSVVIPKITTGSPSFRV